MAGSAGLSGGALENFSGVCANALRSCEGKGTDPDRLLLLFESTCKSYGPSSQFDQCLGMLIGATQSCWEFDPMSGECGEAVCGYAEKMSKESRLPAGSPPMGIARSAAPAAKPGLALPEGHGKQRPKLGEVIGIGGRAQVKEAGLEPKPEAEGMKGLGARELGAKLRSIKEGLSPSFEERRGFGLYHKGMDAGGFREASREAVKGLGLMASEDPGQALRGAKNFFKSDLIAKRIVGADSDAAFAQLLKAREGGTWEKARGLASRLKIPDKHFEKVRSSAAELGLEPTAVMVGLERACERGAREGKKCASKLQEAMDQRSRALRKLSELYPDADRAELFKASLASPDIDEAGVGKLSERFNSLIKKLQAKAGRPEAIEAARELADPAFGPALASWAARNWDSRKRDRLLVASAMGIPSKVMRFADKETPGWESLRQEMIDSGVDPRDAGRLFQEALKPQKRLNPRAVKEALGACLKDQALAGLGEDRLFTECGGILAKRVDEAQESTSLDQVDMGPSNEALLAQLSANPKANLRFFAEQNKICAVKAAETEPGDETADLEREELRPQEEPEKQAPTAQSEAAGMAEAGQLSLEGALDSDKLWRTWEEIAKQFQLVEEKKRAESLEAYERDLTSLTKEKEDAQACRRSACSHTAKASSLASEGWQEYLKAAEKRCLETCGGKPGEAKREKPRIRGDKAAWEFEGSYSVLAAKERPRIMKRWLQRNAGIEPAELDRAKQTFELPLPGAKLEEGQIKERLRAFAEAWEALRRQALKAKGKGGKP